MNTSEEMAAVLRLLVPAQRSAVLLAALLAVVLATARTVCAQTAPTPASQGEAQPEAVPSTAERACDGCPERRVGSAFLQTTIVNTVYGLANLARGQVTAKITPKTWWANMEQGWVWDLDDFLVNQIGHPYRAAITSTPDAPTA